jgi:hypothetical protein
MVKHFPAFVLLKSKIAAFAAVALLTALFPTGQLHSAPLAGSPPQLKLHQAEGVFVLIGTKAFHERRALNRYGYHRVRFRYAGTFPGYRYTVLNGNYEDSDYYPPQPHYFSHRYNWWPPLATFRYPDGPWYAW